MAMVIKRPSWSLLGNQWLWKNHSAEVASGGAKVVLAARRNDVCAAIAVSEVTGS